MARNWIEAGIHCPTSAYLSQSPKCKCHESYCRCGRLSSYSRFRVVIAVRISHHLSL